MIEFAVGLVVSEKEVVLLRAFHTHVGLPARFFGIEMKIKFFLVIDSKFDIVARGRTEEIKTRFEDAVLFLKDEHAFGRESGGVEGVSAAGVVVAEIHDRILTAIDEEGEAIALVGFFLFGLSIASQK